MARSIEPTKQRVVKRSPLYVAFPVIVIAILSVNLGWEVIKANQRPADLTSWPFRFVFLDRASSAALLGVFTGLYLARLQWAKASRPTLGYTITDHERVFKASKDEWYVWIFNGGPGVALVESFRYVVAFHNHLPSVPTSLIDIDKTLEGQGLISGEDYFIREIGSGFAFPAVAKDSDGVLICWFKVEALAAIDKFDVELRVKDALGDTHERTLEIVGKLPRPAVNARDSYREQKKKATKPPSLASGDTK